MPSSLEPLPAAVPERDRAVILAGILLALFLAALDQTIVATALPRIVEDLHGVSRYAWVATAYLLASTALVPIYGKLADTYSRKKVEIGAVLLFLAGSALCGMAGEFGDLPLLGDGMTQLVVFRAVQGAGGAGLFAMALIVIADLFTPAERGRYQGLVGAVWGIASILGPLLGGLLTDHAGGLVPGIEGWRWVFYVNMPLGAVALWFLVRRMPPLRPAGDRGPPDVVSGALLLSGLIALILALQIDKRRFPWLPGLAAPGAENTPAWHAWATPGLAALACVLLLGFVARSRRTANPILDLTLFENRVVRRANAAVFFFGATFLSIIIFLPLFLVNVLGVSATRAGVALIPFSLGVVAGSTLAGQVVSRVGHLRDLILVGGFIVLGAVLFLARMTVDVAYWRVTLYMVMAGAGMGPSLPLFPLAVQNAADVRRIGQATSMTQFFRQMGGAMGAAVMGTILGVTLGVAFARIELPSALESAGRGGESAVERLSATGGGDLPARVRTSYEALAERVEAAVRGGDAAEMRRVAADPDLPQRVSIEVGDVIEGAGPTGSDRTDLAARLGSEVRAHGEQVATAASEGVRRAFAEANHRVYSLALALVVIGLVLTFRIPELPLRRTHDRPVALE